MGGSTRAAERLCWRIQAQSARQRDPRSPWHAGWLRGNEVCAVFTGIVEELGEIVAIEEFNDAARLTVRGPLVTADAVRGDSIAINGVCLTVTDFADGTFSADVISETLSRSSLGALAAGSPVNLERPMRLDERLRGYSRLWHGGGNRTLPGPHPRG